MERTDRIIEKAKEILNDISAPRHLIDTVWGEGFLSGIEVRSAVLALVRARIKKPDTECRKLRDRHRFSHDDGLAAVVAWATLSCYRHADPKAWESHRMLRPSEIRDRANKYAEALDEIIKDSRFQFFVDPLKDHWQSLEYLRDRLINLAENIPVKRQKVKGSSVRGTLIDELTGLFRYELGTPLDQVVCGFVNATFPTMKPTSPATLRARRAKR